MSKTLAKIIAHTILPDGQCNLSANYGPLTQNVFCKSGRIGLLTRNAFCRFLHNNGPARRGDTNILSHVRDLLATCLNIRIKEPKNEPIIWVENLAGVRIAKIKPGIYNIQQLYNELSVAAAKIIGHDQYIIYIRHNNKNIQLSIPCNQMYKHLYLNIDIILTNNSQSDDIVIMVPVYMVQPYDVRRLNSYTKRSNLLKNTEGILHMRIDGKNYDDCEVPYTINEKFNISIIGKIFGFDIETIVGNYLYNYLGNYICKAQNDNLPNQIALPCKILKQLNRFYNIVAKKKSIIKVKGVKIDIKLCASGLGCHNIYKSDTYSIITIDKLCQSRADNFVKEYKTLPAVFEYENHKDNSGYRLMELTGV
jgi:hypothetical protein